MAQGVHLELSSVLAIAGIVGTVALLILNLRVNGAMGELKTDLQVCRTEFALKLSEVKLSVSELRGDLYQEHAKLYAQVMEKSTAQYMNRELSIQMHGENVKHGQELEKKIDSNFSELGKRIDDLTTRVTDIS